jgi:hypothetical protein
MRRLEVVLKEVSVSRLIHEELTISKGGSHKTSTNPCEELLIIVFHGCATAAESHGFFPAFLPTS